MRESTASRVCLLSVHIGSKCVILFSSPNKSLRGIRALHNNDSMYLLVINLTLQINDKMSTWLLEISFFFDNLRKRLSLAIFLPIFLNFQLQLCVFNKHIINY